ncbi:MAG: HD domain-containing protein, partial [Candidatus Eisenbacteria bacterium]|nr:HD domain-containing protein [Candidatus Latescibacterota bacterium]MBD3303070.1 HD domain-containing protein [Candidatus Eisenbacteria bacterium]
MRTALLADLEQLAPDLDPEPVLRALEWARRAHEGQFRASGEPYLTHPIHVTRIILDLLRRRADETVLSAAILHDVVEDSATIALPDLESEFGTEVAQLVDGVTKIGGLPTPNVELEQSENFRKMLLSMAQDIRVILIKLADRLHNMRT